MDRWTGEGKIKRQGGEGTGSEQRQITRVSN